MHDLLFGTLYGVVRRGTVDDVFQNISSMAQPQQAALLGRVILGLILTVIGLSIYRSTSAQPISQAPKTPERIDETKPQLEPAAYELLAKLAAAICDRSKRSELEALELWKNLVDEQDTGPLLA